MGALGRAAPGRAPDADAGARDAAPGAAVGARAPAGAPGGPSSLESSLVLLAADADVDITENPRLEVVVCKKREVKR